MGKTLATILGIAVIFIGALLIWNGGDGDLAENNANATTTEENGIGGPDDANFDPLNPGDTDGDGDWSDEDYDASK
ncbi:MAG: hypothetical protein WDZ61_00070 [Parcubacteria group bacterium]